MWLCGCGYVRMGVVVDVCVEMGCVGVCGQVCVMGKSIGLMHII